MIERKKGDKRYKINYSKKVFVYKNLHKDCWSIKQGGLVKAHTEEIRLWDCSFKVNPQGRKKVIKEQRKNVHAGIVGYIDEMSDLEIHDTQKRYYQEEFREVTYNPYRYDSFVDKTTEKPIYYSQSASLTQHQVLVV